MSKEFAPQSSHEQLAYRYGKSLAARAINALQNQTLQEEISRLEELNMVDGKTGLLNDKGLEHAYDKLIATHNEKRRKSDKPAIPKTHSLLFADMDIFKKANEILGHGDADKLLFITGQFLKGNVRDEDSVGRFGGDEFVVILPETTQEDAAMLAERIRQSVNGITEIEGKQINPSMSIGVGVVDPTLSFSDTLKQANEAMYRAKENGRNQVIVFGEAA